jgi:hypothetical protein
VILPSGIWPPTSEEVAFFHAVPSDVARWLKDRFQAEGARNWAIESLNPSNLAEAFDIVRPNPERRISKYLFLPLAGSWTVLVNDATLGTDTGMIPSLWARDGLGSAIRAVSILERPNAYQGTILEVYDPKASDEVLRLQRGISAINDGGQWRFDQEGDPFPFEVTNMYSNRQVPDRFSHDILSRYLIALGVPAVEESNLCLPQALLLRRNP